MNHIDNDVVSILDLGKTTQVLKSLFLQIEQQGIQLSDHKKDITAIKETLYGFYPMPKVLDDFYYDYKKEIASLKKDIKTLKTAILTVAVCISSLAIVVLINSFK